MKRSRGFSVLWLVLSLAATVLTMGVCVSVGSVPIPLWDTLRTIFCTVFHLPVPEDVLLPTIISAVRLPRVLNAALVGAALSVSGCAMQGLLRNPLADGSTLGVSGGASLGAVVAIAFGITLPSLPFAGTMVLSVAFAFGSLLLILGLAYRLDATLSTNTIILIGVIFSMLTSSVTSLVLAFSPDKARDITFWTLGSLANGTYQNALVLGVALAICGAALFCLSEELNAFAVGEDNARAIGVSVRRVKLTVLIASSVLIGVCVSIGGTIGFVGLVTPHILRMVTGPNHKRLLPACLFGGAILVMLCDLAARTVVSPMQLPIGVVTSIIGAVTFIMIFYATRRKGHA